jgi:hypothetical protein
MQESSNTKKIAIAAVTLILLGGGIYFFFFSTGTAPEVQFDEFGNPTGAQVVGQDLIDISNQLEKVSLDAKLFSNKAFIELVDFGLVLRDEPIGKKNPFRAANSAPGGTRTSPATPISR